MWKIITLLALFTTALHAQTDSLSVAKFTTTTRGNTTILQPQLPTLQQVAGAPVAFYTYFWELGDGKYSTQNTPKHNYKNKGSYKVHLWATNNYGIERPPATRPQEINTDSASAEETPEDEIPDDLDLVRNREPMPGEDLLFVLRYKNSKEYITNGKLYLFYNEMQFKNDNFDIKEGRFYHNETWGTDAEFAYTHQKDDSYTQVVTNNNEISSYQAPANDSINRLNLPATLQAAKEKYRDWKQVDFANMEPNEKRNLFFTLHTPPEMVKDTSAIISIRGVYVPDANYDDHKVKDMEMEIVTSHDPNKMSTSNTFINYRLARFKRIKYKIKFQNNGEGPARTVRLETDIPDMFEKTTIRVEKQYPECPICPKNKEVRYSCLDTTFTDTQAIFTYKNIYLPGSEQKNVKEYDSTKGFVKYSLKFKKDIRKRKTKSRTAIIFDKNEPIITNYSTTRFTPGISIEAKAGYNLYNGLDNAKSFFVGGAVSTYQSYRFYWQAELLAKTLNFDNNSNFEGETPGPIGAAGNEFFFPNETIIKTNVQDYRIEVPILLRYNINDYIGIGAGVLADVLLSQKSTINEKITVYENEEKRFILEDLSSERNYEEKESLNDITPSFLIDLTLGKARIGPSIGVRYIMNSENNYWQTYARWKF